ncbi:MAG: helix-turn-helix domain-containing protein, partial [Polyangiaceae bacterium]
MPEERLDQLLRSIAANVRRLRRRRGLTQERLAERAGIDLSYLQRVERAGVNLSMSKLLQVADAFGIPPGLLLRRAQLPPLRRG